MAPLLVFVCYLSRVHRRHVYTTSIIVVMYKACPGQDRCMVHGARQLSNKLSVVKQAVYVYPVFFLCFLKRHADANIQEACRQDANKCLRFHGKLLEARRNWDQVAQLRCERSHHGHEHCEKYVGVKRVACQVTCQFIKAVYRLLVKWINALQGQLLPAQDHATACQRPQPGVRQHARRSS